MNASIRTTRFIRAAAILIAIVAVGLISSGVATARADQAILLTLPEDSHLLYNLTDSSAPPLTPSTPVNCTDTTCPSAPTGYDKCVERPKFCVYYDTASISETEADWAADQVQLYWDRFVALGFNEPKYSTKLVVQLTGITDDCNGGTGWSSNVMDTYAGCFDVTLQAKRVLGHELTHRMQYAHDTGTGAPIQTKFLKEGTARATEDNWFLDLDNWPDAAFRASFNQEANNYLAATNNDITSYAMRYKSCLWWKYAMEQYGTVTTEPERGIDFVRTVYEQNTLGYSSIAAVNQALSALGAGTQFNQSFKQFAVANWTKDLTGVPDGSYNFIDEDEPGNPAPYGPLVPDNGGTVSIGTDANWDNRYISNYGLRYYEADVGSSCPVVSVSFHLDISGQAFFHIITQNGSTFNDHVQGSGDDWTQAFLNDGITKVIAVVGSLANSAQVDLSVSCADPVLEIKMPNSAAVARTQPDAKFLVQVQVTDGSSTGPVVAGLSNDDFKAYVEGVEAPVTGGGFIQEQYWLLVQAPGSLADGTYDLEIVLEEPGTSTPLASDTNPNSLVYTEDLTDQVLIIDRSMSMSAGTPDRLSAAKDAASFYVDVTRIDDGLAVVPYHHDVAPDPFDMQEVDSSVRLDAKAYINDLEPDGWTSIGDGLKEAINQVSGSPTGNPICSFVLLSDGMENEEEFWVDVETDVINSGCPVTTIAFGPESDETLMQEIASATGGLYFYNDVYISSVSGPESASPADMSLDLGNTYEYAEARAEGRQRLLAEKGQVSHNNPQNKHAVMVDETISEAVFSLDWYEQYYADLKFTLVDPQGRTYDSSDPGYSFQDDTNHHVGFRVPNPEPGLWSLIVDWVQSEEGTVPYQVYVSGASIITLELLLPDRLGHDYYTGDQVPIYAILSSKQPIPNVLVEAFVTAPDGTETTVPMFDDGEHGDGAPSDGFYAGLYTALNQAEIVYPSIEDAEHDPDDEGGYRVLARATHEKFQREAMGAFAILEGPDENGNRIPDNWEKLHGVEDPEGDPDKDHLINYEEYGNGTDPNDPDTDDGGENDGSEVNHNRDPLNPVDDQIRAPDFLQVRPLNSAVLLRYDFKPGYDLIRLFRGLSPEGPWGEVEIPPDQPRTIPFTDTIPVNNETYFYRFEGVILSAADPGSPEPSTPAAEEIVSAILTSEPVTPLEDPLPPEAEVIINDGATSTKSTTVRLSFIPYESEGSEIESFEDIAWMMVSNHPSFEGALWGEFEQDVEWELEARPGEIALVYVRFKDKSNNESVGPEIGMILYDPDTVYLPLTVKNAD